MAYVGIGIGYGCNGGMRRNTGKTSNDNEGNTAGSGNTGKTYTIAVSQIVEHPSLDATYEGFVAALKDAGIEEGKNLKIDFNNAQGDPANIKTISQKIASAAKADLAFRYCYADSTSS